MLFRSVTRIVPVAYNGYTLDTDHPWVDSPLVDKYAKIYTKEMKFDDVRLQEDAEGDAEDDVIVCRSHYLRFARLYSVLQSEC